MRIRKTKPYEKGTLLFYCPGCKEYHQINDSWQFNNNFEKPTISPSILVRGTRLTEQGRSQLEEWENEGYPNRHGEKFDSEPSVCHSFVKDGQIQFLNDCTHELSGQTVELEELEG